MLPVLAGLAAYFSPIAPAYGADAQAAPRIITSPTPLPTRTAGEAAIPRIFLGGSIDMGRAANWQAELPQQLADLRVGWLNPRRADWNPAWKAEASEPEFRRQVEWELAALEDADIIILYFAAGTQSPISLLELGLYARSGKLIVLAPDGFWRKGNIDITAERYGVEQVADMPALAAAIRRRVALLGAANTGGQ